MTEIKNPCIGVCKYDDKVCIGCYRSMKETANWKNYNIDEKQQVLKNIEIQKLKHNSEINTYDYYV